MSIAFDCGGDVPWGMFVSHKAAYLFYTLYVARKNNEPLFLRIDTNPSQPHLKEKQAKIEHECLTQVRTLPMYRYPNTENRKIAESREWLPL